MKSGRRGAQSPILGQVPPGLTHEPHRRVLEPFSGRGRAAKPGTVGGVGETCMETP